MTPAIEDGPVQVYLGDALNVLKELPAESVHCVVTSPPYFGLRDYGTGEWLGGDPECDHKQGREDAGFTNGRGEVGPNLTSWTHRAATPRCRDCGAVRQDDQLGLEDTPQEYVANMVALFHEVWRVLRRDGTVWVNMGDTYAQSYGAQGKRPGGIDKDGRAIENMPRKAKSRKAIRAAGLKRKDLIGVPWRLALALQDAGWWLRSDIVWAKTNAMPSSVHDRPTASHEYMFLLAKGEHYFYDEEAVRETASYGVPHAPAAIQSPYGQGFTRRAKMPDGWATYDGAHSIHRDGRERGAAAEIPLGRNLRDVWFLSTTPYPDQHFATYPEKLVEPCIKAGTSEHGVCATCGAPWRRVVAREGQGYDGSKYGERVVAASGGALGGGTARSTLGRPNGKLTAQHSTLGWEPTCTHDAAVVPATVLDPFAGSGTTLAVARRLGRRSVGIELNSADLPLIAGRVGASALPLLEFARDAETVRPQVERRRFRGVSAERELELAEEGRQMAIEGRRPRP